MADSYRFWLNWNVKDQPQTLSEHARCTFSTSASYEIPRKYRSMKVDCLNEILNPKVSLPLILFSAILLTVPILLNGVPQGNDLPQHFQFSFTFYESLRSGAASPSISSTTNSGFGDVGVRFYPPFSYYVLAFFRYITGSWFNASAVAFCFWFFVGGLGVYFWSREHFDNAGSFTAALAYMAAPYHVNEIYNASLFAEFAAAALLPFCFLFVSRICKAATLANALGLAVFFALLILTHLPSAIIGSVGLGVFSLVSLFRSPHLKTLGSLLFAVGTGLLLSSYYWLRMITELQWVNHSTVEFAQRAYDFRSNFIASYFYTSADVYADRSLGFSDLMALMAVCLFVPSLLFYLFENLRDRDARVKISGAIAVFFLAVFFATPLSSAVWENVPLLQKIQFPFRWMILVNLTGAFFVAAGFSHVWSAFSSKYRPFATLAAGLFFVAVAFTAAQVIRPALYLPKEGFDEYVTDLSHKASYSCWWPIWAKAAALSDKDDLIVNERSELATKWTAYEKIFDVGSGSPSTVQFATFYYPHWKAEVNGNQASISYDENGAMLVHLSEAPARVKVFFEEPVKIRTAGFVSVVSWLTVLLISLFLFLRKVVKYVDYYSNRKPV